jgi:hypothetical protein
MDILTPPPPWIEFPNEAFYWGGWKQGSGEVWMLSIWIPFWLTKDSIQRAAYLTKWPPPDDEWAWWIAHFDLS